MGLRSWIPYEKPVGGYEQEFNQCIAEARDLAINDKENKKRLEDLKKQWKKIPKIDPKDTLGGLKIGRDSEAKERLKEAYLEKSLPIRFLRLSFDEVFKAAKGKWLLQHLPECDGFTFYHGDGYWFAGRKNISFAIDEVTQCENIFPEGLYVDEFYDQTASELVRFWPKILQDMKKIVKEKSYQGFNEMNDQRVLQLEGHKKQVFIIYHLAKWSIFWGERGHGKELFLSQKSFVFNRQFKFDTYGGIKK